MKNLTLLSMMCSTRLYFKYSTCWSLRWSSTYSTLGRLGSQEREKNQIT